MITIIIIMQVLFLLRRYKNDVYGLSKKLITSGKITVLFLGHMCSYIRMTTGLVLHMWTDISDKPVGDWFAG